MAAGQNAYKMKENDPTSELFPENLETLSESDLYQAIKARVEYLLETSPDLLMSYLYRLDVLEVKINAVLAPDSPVAPIEGLSRLILERQKERIETNLKAETLIKALK